MTDTNTKTLDELRDEALEIRKTMDDLKARISEAKSDAFTRKKFVNPVLFRSWERALRDAQADYQAVQWEMGDARRALGRKRVVEDTDLIAKKRAAFVQTAKRRLDAKTFDALWDEAVADLVAQGVNVAV